MSGRVMVRSARCQLDIPRSKSPITLPSTRVLTFVPKCGHDLVRERDRSSAGKRTQDSPVATCKRR